MDSYDDSCQSLLELEVDLGMSLLRRHRPSHGRTRYYRLLNMAVRHLVRSETMSMYSHWKDWKRIRITTETTEWSLEEEIRATKKRTTTTSSSSSSSSQKQDLESRLNNWVTDLAPNVLSRLESSAQVLMGEVIRGFFLPLNVTWLALVSRLWTLIRTLRHDIMGDLGLAQPVRNHATATTATARTRKNKQFAMTDILTTLGIKLGENSFRTDHNHPMPNDDTHKTAKSIPENTNNVAKQLSNIESDDVGERVVGINPKNNIFTKQQFLRQNPNNASEKPTPKKTKNNQNNSNDNNNKKKKKKKKDGLDFFDDLFAG